jgi:ferredoxin
MMKRFKLEEIEEAILSESYYGFCIACGACRDGCEPDAREYECEECGEHKVYGAEELLLMGLVD